MFGNGNNTRLNSSLAKAIEDLTSKLLKSTRLFPPYSVGDFIKATKGEILIENTFYPKIDLEHFSSGYEYRITVKEEFLESDCFKFETLKSVSPFFLKTLDTKEINSSNSSPFTFSSNLKVLSRNSMDYFVFSLLMPKEDFFKHWLIAQQELKNEKMGLFTKNEAIVNYLSEIFQVHLEDVRHWQWALKYDFIDWKNRALGRTDRIDEAKDFALIIRKQVKSVDLAKIIGFFNGRIVNVNKPNQEPDFFPTDNAEYDFIIYMPKYTCMSNLEKKRKVVGELCDFFFEGEASLEEKSAFALTLFPKPKQ